MLVVYPLLCLLAAYGLFVLLKRFFSKGITTRIVFAGVLLFTVLSLSSFVSYLQHDSDVNPNVELFKAEMNRLSLENPGFPVGVTSPLYALESDARVASLLYYPHQEEIVDVVFFNSCDLSGNSAAYEAMIAEQVDRATENFSVVFEKVERECAYRIYERIS